jgi:hypothetical protein
LLVVTWENGFQYLCYSRKRPTCLPVVARRFLLTNKLTTDNFSLLHLHRFQFDEDVADKYISLDAQRDAFLVIGKPAPAALE